MKLPTEKQIEQAIEKYGFQVPYDGTDDFYNKEKMKHFKNGIIWLKNYLTNNIT